MLPVAKMAGGVGGGTGTRSGTDDKPENGSGGGIGLTARGLGVFVAKDGAVTWRPAIDVNRVILGGQVVAVVAFLMPRALIQARSGATPGRRLPRATRLFVRGGHPTVRTPRRCAPAAVRRRRRRNAG